MGDVPSEEWVLEGAASDAVALAALAGDRYWNGYSIADLAPPLHQWTRVAVRRRAIARRRSCSTNTPRSTRRSRTAIPRG